MSIQSHAFGRVTLTDGDADKFTRQVRYGKPKAAAVEGVRQGVSLTRDLQKDGAVRIWLKENKKIA